MGTCFTATDSFSKFSEYSPCRTCKLENSLLSLSYHHHKAMHSKNHLSFWRKKFLTKVKIRIFGKKLTEKFAKFCLHNADHHHFSFWRYFFTTKLKIRTYWKIREILFTKGKIPFILTIFFFTAKLKFSEKCSIQEVFFFVHFLGVFVKCIEV